MLTSPTIGNDDQSNLDYYHQIVEPFKAPLCRVPGAFVQGTQLVRDRATFQITIGAGANDFVAYFAPENSIRTNVSQSPAPQDLCIIARTSALVDYSSLSYGGHVNSATSTNYASRQAAWQQTYSSYWQAVRLVSAGLRIRYIGRQDAEAGLISAGMTSMRAPHNSSVLNDSVITEFPFNYRGKTADGLACNWIPTDFTDQSFINVSTSDSQSVSAQNVFFIHGFGIPDGTVLDVEFVRNYEYYPKYQYQELLNPSTTDKQSSSSFNPKVQNDMFKSADFITSALEGASSLFSSIQSFFGKVSFSVPFGK